MGKLFREYLNNSRVYICSGCHSHLACHDQLVSKVRTSEPQRLSLLFFPLSARGAAANTWLFVLSLKSSLGISSAPLGSVDRFCGLMRLNPCFHRLLLSTPYRSHSKGDWDARTYSTKCTFRCHTVSTFCLRVCVCVCEGGGGSGGKGVHTSIKSACQVPPISVLHVHDRCIHLFDALTHSLHTTPFGP